MNEPSPPVADGRRTRVAVLSLHTSPLDQPGTGDSGGMNVYIRSVAERLGGRGVDVDVFTRCRGRDVPEVEDIAGGGRVIQIQAGPCAPVAKADLPVLLPQFLNGILERRAREDVAYDVVHSHYWLSGWVGERMKRDLDAPLVASFHTLGKVKNFTRASSDLPEPAHRLDQEERVVDSSDAILATTPAEAAQLVGLYGARPEQVRVIPPGVDMATFAPKDPGEARARLGLVGKRVLVFVGRLQQLKGPDVAIRALAEAVNRDPMAMRDVVLAVVGGPSGPSAGASEVSHLMDLASTAGVADRVQFYPPQSHERLGDFYSAAEAVLVPSRSESFGLVALEAQACGAPVVGASVGGLRLAVADGESGFLICGHDPADYADRILQLLTDPGLAEGLRAGAVRHARRFSWDTTTGSVLEVYRELGAAA
jgi:D-inositol-3-phosphate glycosyltransferase